MVNFITLILTHGLMALAAIMLLSRDELDEEGEADDKPRRKPWQRAKGE
ncbi:hypothetical protein [Alteraurantiacibacter aquimixticola]|nr:hypothetical protein [Alteraurantiacibacter aquimixticola]